MIYSSFGSPVSIVGADAETFIVTIRYADGDEQMDVHAALLKADGGWDEIEREVTSVALRSQRV